MNIKNFVFISPLLISVATALTAGDVSGAYTVHGTSWDKATQTSADQLSSLNVKKIDATTVNVSMSWLSGGGGCYLQNAVGTVNGYNVTVQRNACTLTIHYGVEKSQISFSGTDSCTSEICDSAGGDVSYIAFPWNSQSWGGQSQTTLKPIEGQSLCFEREYTTQHLAQQPGQTPASFNLIITKSNGRFTGSLSIWTRGENGVEYDGGGYCDTDTTVPFTSGKASCSTASGQYLLENQGDGSILLKPYNWVELKNPDNNATVRLDNDDASNSKFLLYPGTSCFND